MVEWLVIRQVSEWEVSGERGIEGWGGGLRGGEGD